MFSRGSKRKKKKEGKRKERVERKERNDREHESKDDTNFTRFYFLKGLNEEEEEECTEVPSIHNEETELKLREYRLRLLQTQKLHSQACQETINLRRELGDLRTQLKIQQRRTEYETRRREHEEHRSALLLLKSRRVAYGASATIVSDTKMQHCQALNSRKVTSHEYVTTETQLSPDKVTPQQVKTTQKVMTSQEVMTSREVMTSHEVKRTWLETTSQMTSPETLDSDNLEMNADSFEDLSSDSVADNSKDETWFCDIGDLSDKETFLWDVDEPETLAPLAEEESPLEEWNIHENVWHRGEADGRSRSASPRVVEKDVAKKRVKLPDVKAPKKSEVEVGDGVTSSQSFPCFIFLYIYKMLRERFIVLPLECTHQELSFEWSHL